MTKEADRQTSDQRPNQTHKPWNGDSQIPESVDKHSQWSSAVAEAGQDRLRFIWTLNRRELPHSCCSAVYSEIEKSTLSNHSGSLSSAPVFLHPPPHLLPTPSGAVFWSELGRHCSLSALLYDKTRKTRSGHQESQRSEEPNYQLSSTEGISSPHPSTREMEPVMSQGKNSRLPWTVTLSNNLNNNLNTS